jgi:hypothetical protein
VLATQISGASVEEIDALVKEVSTAKAVEDLLTAARDIATKYTSRTAEKEMTTLTAKYLPDGSGNQEVQALLHDVMRAKAKEDEVLAHDAVVHSAPVDPRTAEAPDALVIAARGLFAMYTPRTAEQELMAIATQYVPVGASEEEVLALVNQAQMVRVREDLAMFAKELAANLTPRAAAEELASLAAQYLPGGTSEEINALAEAAQSTNTKEHLARAAKELAAKYTPRTAVKELHKVAAEIVPDWASDEQVHAFASEVSNANAKKQLAIAAKEVAAQYTPRTAEMELLALAAQYLPADASEDELRSLAGEAWSTIVAEDLAIAAKELAAKYTPRTAESELAMLAAKYLPPGASEEQVQALVYAAHSNVNADVEVPDALAAAAGDLYSKYTPRTAERELNALAGQFLPPGASDEELHSLTVAAAATGSSGGGIAVPSDFAEAARELEAQCTPRTAEREIMALASQYLPPGANQADAKALAASASVSEASIQFLQAAARELEALHTPRTAEVELKALAGKYLPPGAGDDEIQAFLNVVGVGASASVGPTLATAWPSSCNGKPSDPNSRTSTAMPSTTGAGSSRSSPFGTRPNTRTGGQHVGSSPFGSRPGTRTGARESPFGSRPNTRNATRDAPGHNRLGVPQKGSSSGADTSSHEASAATSKTAMELLDEAASQLEKLTLVEPGSSNEPSTVSADATFGARLTVTAFAKNITQHIIQGSNACVTRAVGDRSRSPPVGRH